MRSRFLAVVTLLHSNDRVYTESSIDQVIHVEKCDAAETPIATKQLSRWMHSHSYPHTSICLIGDVPLAILDYRRTR